MAIVYLKRKARAAIGAGLNCQGRQYIHLRRRKMDEQEYLRYDHDYTDWDEDDWDEDDWDDPCDRCGPWCEHWGGDGLCVLALEQFAAEREEFEKYVFERRTCPVCGVELIEYQITVDKLWQWPGDINPIIGLEIYAALGTPKGELHRAGPLCHIWVGEGEYRQEKLIRLLGQNGTIDEGIPF